MGRLPVTGESDIRAPRKNQSRERMTPARPLTVLGIDPGTASTGYGVVEYRAQQFRALCAGVISTRADDPLERRLAGIYGLLEEVMDAHHPTAMAVEDIFFSRNVRTAFAVGQARGAALAAAGLRGVPCFAYTPQAVKLAVCGRGGGQAGKDQVGRMVAALLGLEHPPEPDHASDALAVAICHAHRSLARRTRTTAGHEIAQPTGS
jgi:crossover junction endodeoxyribonuclease RuvC